MSPIVWHNLKVMFPIYKCTPMISSRKSVVDLTSYNVVIRPVIYERGTCTCAVRRFSLESTNTEIRQHVCVHGCNCLIIGIRDYRNNLIFKIGNKFRSEWYWWGILSRLLTSRPLLANENIRKEHFSC